MALTLYKPGQGYWTRMLTAVGVGIIVLSGVAWLWNQLTRINSPNITYIQAGVCAPIVLVAFLVTWWLLNKPNIVEFMIATEAEMRKVAWPSRREVIGATWIVICGVFLLAAILFVIDMGFVALFKSIKVIEG